MEFDYIIVGQGLAGSAVAIQLLKRKKKILVIDEPEKNNSSRIAAGLFNPVTGKKMVKTWLADELFPYLHKYYREVEALTGFSFFHPLPLYRPFLSIEEQNEWMGRSTDPYYAPYIDQVLTKKSVNQVHDPFGGLLLRRCGYLDTHQYILAVRIRIQQEASLLEEAFKEDQLVIRHDHIQYKNYNAAKIIFCQGAHASRLFGWLPIRPLKGETIRIRADFNEKMVVNRGIYVVPTEQPGTRRIGATYNFQDKEPGITPEGRRELEDKMKELVSFPYEVISQEWGVRPTTPDRRPILGGHPEAQQAVIFNGLGTKGVSLAPYFSEVLVRWLENSGTINKEVDIERYKSVYSGSPK
jgi:glycine/D-amino acid oxidase-like deaminating enzyme